MRLKEEIFKALGGEGDALRVQYTVIDGRGGYFQNVKRIKELTSERIVLCGAHGGVRIEGEALSLGKYYAGDAAISGDIQSVVREG